MRNPIFDELVQELTPLLGAAKDHTSATGVRFTSSTKGKVTVYHSNLATGNHAEVAIDIASNAARMQLSEREMRDRINQARMATGRDVERNAQYDWPRIGLAGPEHIPSVLQALRLATV